MKNRQRHGYKQHWSKEYRRLVMWHKINAIFKEHYRQHMIDLLYSESPLMIMIPRKVYY